MSKKEEAEYEEYESLKNSKFKQQKLPGWRPVPSMARATTIFFALGIVFSGLGVLILLFSNKTVEYIKRYDNETDCILDTNCTIEIEIKKKMNKNIMVYYQLENFYQNHRRYIQSKIEYSNNSILLGLMGKNYFNDVFDGWKKKGSSDNLKFNDKNIARKSDLEKYKDFTVLDYDYINMRDDHFLVWMRPAPLTNFTKLYGRIEEDIEENSIIEVNIMNNYNSSNFNGSKYLILRTVNNFGGDNTFLAIGYMIFGGICLILGITFTIGYKIKAKKEK